MLFTHTEMHSLYNGDLVLDQKPDDSIEGSIIKLQGVRDVNNNNIFDLYGMEGNHRTIIFYSSPAHNTHV